MSITSAEVYLQQAFTDIVIPLPSSGSSMAVTLFRSQSCLDIFHFFYKLNVNHGNMIYGDKFNEFLAAFTSNPFRQHEDKAFRKELIENLIKYSFDHMSLLTAALLLKKKFTIDEVIQNYYSTVDAFGYDMF